MLAAVEEAAGAVARRECEGQLFVLCAEVVSALRRDVHSSVTPENTSLPPRWSCHIVLQLCFLPLAVVLPQLVEVAAIEKRKASRVEMRGRRESECVVGFGRPL